MTGEYANRFFGTWLEYDLRSEFLQAAPGSPAGSTVVDVVNALNDTSKTVAFYPIYDIDPGLSYVVVPDMTAETMLETNMGGFTPSGRLSFKNKLRIASVPTWLRTTR